MSESPILNISNLQAEVAEGDLGPGLARERALYLERVLPSSDRLEALAAFREKRKPVYRGE